MSAEIDFMEATRDVAKDILTMLQVMNVQLIELRKANADLEFRVAVLEGRVFE